MSLLGRNTCLRNMITVSIRVLSECPFSLTVVFEYRLCAGYCNCSNGQGRRSLSSNFPAFCSQDSLIPLKFLKIPVFSGLPIIPIVTVLEI